MSRSPEAPASVIERVPGWAGVDDLRIEPLEGGWTNHNYRVEVGGDSFVLRVSGPHVAVLGIDRRAERAALAAAARGGLGPEVSVFLLPEGHQVTRFIEGRTFPWHRAPALPDALRMVEAAREIHAFPHEGVEYSPFRAVDRYISATERAGGKLPDDIGGLCERARAAECRSAARGDASSFCHNDLSLGNFVEDRACRLRVLDWEYAGMGDGFFDLATLVVGHAHDAKTERVLLESYCAGTVSDRDRERLRDMKLMYALREATWAELYGTLCGAAAPLAGEFRRAADDFFGRARELD
jgi:thiamine kinase-like enzyme